MNSSSRSGVGTPSRAVVSGGASASAGTPSIPQLNLPTMGPTLVSAPSFSATAGEYGDSTTSSRREEPGDALAFKHGKVAFVLLSNGCSLETLISGDMTSFPLYGSFCRIHYDARIVGDDGLVGPSFDSSERRGVPFDFQIGSGYVLRAVEEAMMLISRGQKVRLCLPPSCAFGELGHPPIVPGHATVEYTISLVSMQH